jgi:TatA/E family protein of Tat protein translocase
MGLDNPLHIAFLLILLLLVFGAKRLPEMGRSLGHGMRGFKDALSGDIGDPLAATAAPQAGSEQPTTTAVAPGATAGTPATTVAVAPMAPAVAPTAPAVAPTAPAVAPTAPTAAPAVPGLAIAPVPAGADSLLESQPVPETISA